MKMKRLKTAIAIFFILASISVFSVVKAESFDPEVVSQVSKAIAEWKLLNEDKEQTESEQTVYVSSSLSGMVEKDGGNGVSVIKGLSAYIELNQLPDPILWQNADILNTIYKGDIYIRQDSQLNCPGLWNLRTRTIWVNPAKFSNWGTNLGGVLAHEMDHAIRDGFSIIATGRPLSSDFPYNILDQDHAIQAEKIFQKTLQDKFATVSKIAQEIGMKNYNPIDGYKISEAQALRNIETGKFNPNIGAGSQYWNTYKIGSTGLPSMPSTTSYPPPNILFSMPKIPTYSPYSIPKMPTYTPTMPSSSWGRKY